jgi:hypothetical protein
MNLENLFRAALRTSLWRPAGNPLQQRERDAVSYKQRSRHCWFPCPFFCTLNIARPLGDVIVSEPARWKGLRPSG